MRECDSQHFMPAIQYYQMNGEPGGAESAFLSKVQNAATMKSYFGDFKILMQRVKDFGKPVLVLMEADGFGFLQQQTSSNSERLRGREGSGDAGAGRPAQHRRGLGPGVLAAGKSVGATNAMLGVHMSAWASGEDIAYGIGDRRAAAAGRQGVRLPGAVRPGRKRHRARPRTCWSAIRWTATPTTTSWCRGRTAGGTPATARRSLEELQPLCGVAAALERQGERAGCCGRFRSATRTSATSPTTAMRAPATRTTDPSTSSERHRAPREVRRQRRHRRCCSARARAARARTRTTRTPTGSRSCRAAQARS